MQAARSDGTGVVELSTSGPLDALASARLLAWPLPLFTVAEREPDRESHQAEREALVDATNETLAVYADLAVGYDEQIARQAALLNDVDETLARVRAILAGDT